jgi:hypothetical protein
MKEELNDEEKATKINLELMKINAKLKKEMSRAYYLINAATFKHDGDADTADTWLAENGEHYKLEVYE